jgi:catechol 2,3-dioxygenase-like lactoylglutathione lyase family enzyme
MDFLVMKVFPLRTFGSSVGVTAALAFCSTVAYAQTAPPAAAATPGSPRSVTVGMLHLNVTSLEKSMVLYRDVLGMEVTAPAGEPRANSGLVSEPGAKLRTTQLKVPGGTFEVELVEWTGTPLKPQKARVQDPGAVMLAVQVRDIDAKLAAAKTAGFRVLTKGSELFVSDDRFGRNRSAMVQDPDGFIVQLEEGGAGATAPGATTSGPIVGVAVWLSVADVVQTATFYSKVLGLTLPAPAEARPVNERMKALFGDTSLTTLRNVRGTFPGSTFGINFQEFRGPDRKPVHHRVQDPGGPILVISVDDFPAAVAAVQASGGILGPGDTSVPVAADARGAWVRDPNGVLMQLSPPRAAGASGPTAPTVR